MNVLLNPRGAAPMEVEKGCSCSRCEEDYVYHVTESDTRFAGLANGTVQSLHSTTDILISPAPNGTIILNQEESAAQSKLSDARCRAGTASNPHSPYHVAILNVLGAVLS
jgi:hypothetical protein